MMKFKELLEWANDRATDGFWSYQIAVVSLAIIDDVRKNPFWKRERIWRDKYEKDVLDELVTPVNERIEQLKREELEIMRTYTVTEYEKSDYDDYENNITIGEIISNLEHIRRGYVGDYNYTGEEDDFDRFKLHMAVFKAIELLNKIKEEAGQALKEQNK